MLRSRGGVEGHGNDAFFSLTSAIEGRRVRYSPQDMNRAFSVALQLLFPAVDRLDHLRRIDAIHRARNPLT